MEKTGTISKQSQYSRILKSALKRHGILQTLKIAYHELLFDWRYGTETRIYVETKDIQTNSLHQDNGYRYSPLKIPFWEKVFDKSSINFDKTCYIDFGCGKGRTLILAALSGFQKIIGVEYSKELCVTCQKNVIEFQKRKKLSSTIEVVHMDAVEFQIPDYTSTIVFYNPFSPIILEKVVQNIRESFKKSPREISMVYINCSENHKKVFSDFQFIAEFKDDKTVIYKMVQ